MKLRDSLVNMLGEFVGLNKTPDFKLNKRSAQYIAEAVAAESQRSLELRLAHQQKQTPGFRGRISSTNSATRAKRETEVSMNPSYRRSSVPMVQCDRPFLPRFWKLRKPLSRTRKHYISTILITRNRTNTSGFQH
uniref:Uncharacterized protein n=1 Tax=Syphacia muris TaxID=451379 RepID=A0A0N5AEJ0_9BILA